MPPTYGLTQCLGSLDDDGQDRPDNGEHDQGEGHLRPSVRITVEAG